jgi:hypothetical protein
MAAQVISSKTNSIFILPDMNTCKTEEVLVCGKHITQVLDETVADRSANQNT